ncbi:MAG: hypothetical protein HUU56_03250 [Bdellovibrionaceae bacterium]|nr:hypothetical protein [Pseudobdellovibrionaceae bacterium]
MNYLLKTLPTLFFIIISLSLIISAKPVLKQSRKPVPPLPEKSNLEKQFPSVILERVDPHGNKLIKPTEELITSTKECQICHTLENKKVSTHSQIKEICSSCHNKAPHSGIEEHFKHQVSCLDCHAVHRGSALHDVTTNSHIFRQSSDKQIESGFIQRKASTGMLKKTCTECHKL